MRREAMDREKYEKLEQWMHRAEGRRAAKAEQAAKALQTEKMQDIQRRWLIRLALVSYTENLKNKSLAARNHQRYLYQKVASAGVINRFLIRSLISKRREKLYVNVIRARVAFAAYVRHARLGVFNATMPIARGFLEQHHFHREVPSLNGALSRFRGKVRILQKWWKGVRTIRKAYVEFFEPMWLNLQGAFYKAEAEKQAHLQHHQALAEKEARDTSSRTSVGGRRGSQAVGSMSSSLRHGRNKSKCDGMSMLERVKLIEQSQDQLPAYVITVILMEYIVRMQKSYRQRVFQWREDLEKDEFRHDLEGFGIVNEDDEEHGAGPLLKPRLVYIDEEELEVLVQESLEKWREGEWREIRHNRLRILRKTFREMRRWKAIARQAAAQASAQAAAAAAAQVQEKVPSPTPSEPESCSSPEGPSRQVSA